MYIIYIYIHRHISITVYQNGNNRVTFSCLDPRGVLNKKGTTERTKNAKPKSVRKMS